MSTLTLPMPMPLVAGVVFGEGPFYAAHYRSHTVVAERDVVWMGAPVLSDPTFYRWATPDEVLAEHIRLDAATIAELLFVADVDPMALDHNGVREAVDHALALCRCDMGRLAVLLGQQRDVLEESARARMRACVTRARQICGGVR